MPKVKHAGEFVGMIKRFTDDLEKLDFYETDFKGCSVNYIGEKINMLIATLRHARAHIKWVDKERRKKIKTG